MVLFTSSLKSPVFPANSIFFLNTSSLCMCLDVKVYFLLFFGVVLMLDLERRWERGRQDLDKPLLHRSQVKTDGPN